MELCVAEVHEAVAASRPGQDCIVFGDRRLSWADVTERTRRFANLLIEHGFGCHIERSELRNWESGQDHLAIYLHNGNEYLEAMLGAFKARVAPLNVNYRYVADELRYVLTDAKATAIVVHSQLAPTLATVRAELPQLRLILQVPDASGNPLLPGAVWYEDALSSAPATAPPVTWSPDDLYILYTGGTTGVPKGVLWRNGDANVECFGASHAASSAADVVARADGRMRTLLAPPLMHGAAQWVAFRTWNKGGTVVIPSVADRLDPAAVWTTVSREHVNFLLIIGDAFARPLLDELERGEYDVSTLNVVLTGGATLSVPLKEALLARLPTLMIVDGLGSSEAGGQLTHVSVDATAATGQFELSSGNHLLAPTLDRVLDPGDDEIGWLAKSGRVALGYLGDPIGTTRTYPVIDGTRYAVPGDRARLRRDGVVELHGRDSAMINSGGEKIFAEEVEAALKAHPGVYDCVVTSRPSQRWGNEVVAIVRCRDGLPVEEAELLAVAEGQIARYKLPKAVLFVDEIVRSPAGKPDYRWAKRIAAESADSH